MKAQAKPLSLIERIEANMLERVALAANFRELTEGLSLREVVGDFYKHNLDETAALPLLREKIAKAEARKAALALIPRKLAKKAGFLA